MRVSEYILLTITVISGLFSQVNRFQNAKQKTVLKKGKNRNMIGNDRKLVANHTTAPVQPPA